MFQKLIAAYRRLVGTTRPNRVEQDMDDELRFHLMMEEEQLRKLGLPSDEARRAATGGFGGVDQIKEELRDHRRAMWLEDLVRDVRFAARTLASTPGYTTLVVLTLALGIGANAAIFSVINGVLLKPLANADGDRLVVLRQQRSQTGVANLGFSHLDIGEYRSQLQSVDALVEFHTMTFNLLGQGEPEEVQTGVVDHRFFEVLGVPPILGRGFTEEEDLVGRDAVIVMSYRYWQERFGGDPSILGKTFEMNGRVHTVVGVLPPFTQHPIDNDIYVPTSQCPVRSSEPFKANRNARMMTAFARLRPGTSLADVRNEAAVVANRLTASYPDAYPAQLGHNATAQPLKEALVANSRPTLFMLLGAVGFVLLVACANVANLTLARLSRREAELALRSALGAGRGRLLRQLLTESTLLAVVGGALGLGLAYVGSGLLVAFAGRFTPRAAEVGIDNTVLLFTVLISLVTGIVFGCGPALASRQQLSSVLRESTGASSSVRKRRLQTGLVVVQLAVAFILLCGAGLLVRSFVLLLNVDAGVVTENVLALRIVPPIGSYQGTEQQKNLWRPILDRVNAQPGVIASAASTVTPLSGRGLIGSGGVGVIAATFEIEGRPAASQGDRPRARQRNVTPDFFRTVGVPVVRGRAFAETDDTDKPRVALINQTFARTHFDGIEPIGARLMRCSAEGRCVPETMFEIVGVVGDVRQDGLDTEPTEEIYFPAYQTPFFGQNLLVRTSGDPLQLARGIVGFVHEVDPNLPVEDIQTLEMIRNDSLAPRRLTTALLTIFAAVALLVTMAGIVGVTSFSVTQRRHEIGVRMALGASRPEVLRMVLGQSLRCVAAGLAVGLAGTLIFGSLIRGLVWGIDPADPATLLSVSLLFLVVSGFATFWPARRATLVDPTIAFRMN